MMFGSQLRRLSAAAVLVPLLSLVAVAQTQAAAARPEVAKQAKAYSSRDGIKVSTLRYGPRGKNQALVQVTGADSEIDDKILLATTAATQKDTRYTVQLRGRPYVLLILNAGTGELYLPGAQKAAQVGYDAAASEQINAEHYLTDYQEQAAAK
ncbi:hypothetical protein [Xanthomonas campestris]|uniref:hypothetical protein n=1 Tax=Xanthomonas campestris TaxID=339 RepID=UPI0023661DA0|nr:hypothetical protein [Xanthomonas campestris]MEA9709508.1 hypothetical protein [Xanthomonas campestris]MEA9782724.1 hypothetical protein [Xanthomonas campestris pv. raphani]MEA9790852.1 hypothetical protein [Xanthomonas campestris pv. raphani]MEA9803584.1 hypothetical protein [Xanthomonas campestris pv. raphani]MEA9818764.1 hypothetical protein [Xanthomonas campestris pv. raphani]